MMNKAQRGLLMNRFQYLLILLVVFVFLTGCTNNETQVPQDDLEEVTETVIEEEAVVVTEEPVVEEEVIEEPEVEPVTELVYNFDAFESVVPMAANDYFGRDPVKGIYVSGYVAGIKSWMDSLIELADTTEMNAFVIDVKDDGGRITYDMDLAEVDEIGAEGGHIKDISALMDTLYAHDIYPIARIVTFKDPFLAKRKPEYAIKNQDGSLWYYKGVPWLNPYNRDTWDYVLDVAKDAAKKGFKEIQFDYIRFEATRELNNAYFDDLEGDLTRQEIIVEFIDYAMQELKPYGVEVSADVFGIVITSDRDGKTIGQDYVEMSKRLDVICPMVYPSHYGPGFYGHDKPDFYPYDILYGSMSDSNEVLSVIPEGDNKAIVRPWLQAFTASYLGSGNYMVYGKDAIRAQMQATYDAGLEEWILWHAGVKYNNSYLLDKEE